MVLAQSGGEFDLTWSTIDAGGYTLDGGFWASGDSSGASTTGSELYLPLLRR